MSFRFLKNEKKRKWDFSPSVSGSVAVRLTITANLYPLGSISNYHHLKKYELNSLTVGMYVWPEQENGDSI